MKEIDKFEKSIFSVIFQILKSIGAVWGRPLVFSLIVSLEALSWCAFCERRVFRAPLRKVGPAHAAPPCIPRGLGTTTFPIVSIFSSYLSPSLPSFGPSFTFLFFTFYFSQIFFFLYDVPRGPTHVRTSLSSKIWGRKPCALVAKREERWFGHAHRSMWRYDVVTIRPRLYRTGRKAR